MLTADQIRLRLERVADQGEACNGCLALIAVLHAVLPEMVAALQKKADEGSQNPGDTPQQRESGPLSRLVNQKWCHGCKVGFEDAQAHFGSAFHRARAEANADATLHQPATWFTPSQMCPDCKPDVPCKRARELLGQDA